MKDFDIIKFNDVKTDAKVIDEYEVGLYRVTITADGLYNVKSPPITKPGARLAKLAMRDAFSSLAGNNADRKVAGIVGIINAIVKSKISVHIWHEEGDAIMHYVNMKLTGCMEIDALMQDPHVENIVCLNADKEIFVTHGRHPDLKLLSTNITMGHESRLDAWQQTIKSRYDSMQSGDNNVPYYVTEENHKIALTGDGQLRDGQSFMVHKSHNRMKVMTHLLESGTLSAEMAACLWMLVDASPFLLITGETGTGKTTLLTSLLTMLNPGIRKSVLEETKEILLPQPVTYYTCGYDHIADHLDRICTLNPHFVVIGHLIGGRTLREFFRAGREGRGSMAVFYAKGAKDALKQIKETYEIPYKDTSYLWGIVNVSRGKDRKRLVSFTEQVDVKGKTGLIHFKAGDTKPIEFPKNSNAKGKTEWRRMFGTGDAKPIDFKDLMEKSNSLRRAAARLEFTDAEAVENLERRREFLLKCLEKKAYYVESVVGMLNEFYGTPKAD